MRAGHFQFDLPVNTRNCGIFARCSERLNNRPRHRSSTALLGTLRASMPGIA